MKTRRFKTNDWIAGGIALSQVFSVGCSETPQPVKILPAEIQAFPLPESLTAIPLENMLLNADTDVQSGRLLKAVEQLKLAAAHYPADKLPRVKLAQLFFDNGDYPKAIVEAQEALKRDPLDRVADSIIAVSGLRLSIAALNDLRKQNNLTGSIGAEAQNLAKLLRASLGEQVLLPTSTGSSGKVQNEKTITQPKEQTQLSKPKTAGQSQTVASPVNPKPSSFDPFSSLE